MYGVKNINFENNSAFGILTHLNSDELKEFLNDDNKLDEIVKDVKELKDVEKEKELMIATNRSLAEFNLSQEPLLLQIKNEVMQQSDACEALYKSVEEKYNLFSEKTGRGLLDARLSRLQLSTSELEETSEATAEKFLNGESDIEEFLEKFTSQRKLMHLEKVKADKMSEFLNQSGSVFHNSSLVA